ncbi:uncharacterized protein [Rutidosis leptorrhynchoides]|uniref:uncharacterized protein n=1 Tax=Rutidosis leptorrhynchoides TaxID=125765 RepID=UPI003A99A1A2
MHAIKRSKNVEIEEHGGDMARETMSDHNDSIFPSNSRCDYHFPDSEYHIDKDILEDYFLENQVWVVYDILDVMPRSYALVKDKASTRCKLKISWQKCRTAQEGLLVACGKYGNAKDNREVDDGLIFSHLVQFGRAIRRSPKFSFSANTNRGGYGALKITYNASMMDLSSDFVYEVEVNILSRGIGRNVHLIYIERRRDLGYVWPPEKNAPPYKYEVVEIKLDYDDEEDRHDRTPPSAPVMLAGGGVINMIIGGEETAKSKNVRKKARREAE